MDLSNHIVTKIEYSNPDWLKFRLNGIGGSEINILFPEACGGEYSSPLEMYYQKINWVDIPKIDSEPMAYGRWLEELVASRWTFWDGKEDEFGQPNYLHNFENDIVIRKCRRLNGYIQSKDFDWLFASVDRIINQGATNLITGEVMESESILECKTISGYVVDKWQSGIPPAYIFQVNQYMLILGLDYTEIALLKNGRNLSVIPIQKSDVLCEQILERSMDFWKNRVVPGKKAVAEYRKAERFGNTKLMEEAEAYIVSLEPPPTQGEAYRRFLSEKFNAVKTETVGNRWQLSLLKQYEVISYISKYVDGMKSNLYNNILSEFSKEKTNKLDFGADGYARYRSRLTNQVKNNFDKNALNEALEQLNTDWL